MENNSNKYSEGEILDNGLPPSPFFKKKTSRNL
jgi:hypothetical protein